MSEVYFQFEKIAVQKYIDKNSLQKISRMEVPAVEKILQIMALTTDVHYPIPFRISLNWASQGFGSSVLEPFMIR